MSRDGVGSSTTRTARARTAQYLLAARLEQLCEKPSWSRSGKRRRRTVAPELAGHVAAVGFDPDSGRLTVYPDSLAWATKARLEQTRVIEAADTAAGRTVVRALRILPPGTVPAPAPADVAPVAPADVATGLLRTRETASEGYRRGLAAHPEVATPRRVDPGIAEAVERRIRAMRELSRRAFPEPDPVEVRADRPGPDGDSLTG
ncbi:DciA family protein [Streptomyces sp. NPDC057539]|uniref:DciA family protein n=1 Tax=Streptomyces sp. NPDC057539 TaxID=3346159 RepID=UPI003698946C